MKEKNHNSNKPVFLYIVIAVLALSLAALGVLTFAALDRLASLQAKVSNMSDTLEEISASASNLIQESMQLEDLKTEEAALHTEGSVSQEAVSQNTSEDPPQAEGMLSPANGSTFTDNTDASMDQLLVQVNQLLPQNNGMWSVYVCNLLKGTEGTISSTPMQAASLIKLFIMGSVYENYEVLSSQHDRDTLDNTIHNMIIVSDNDAANTLVNWLGNGNNAEGMAKVNAFCQAHGYADTQMNRMLLAGTENGDNYTSVKDCGTFLKEIYQICNNMPTESTLTNAQAMYYHLKMQQRNNKIPAQMPEGVHVANKTGELSDVENDAGIIFDTAKGINLVVCFMSQNLNNTGAAQEAIAANARAIYGYYNE